MTADSGRPKVEPLDPESPEAKAVLARLEPVLADVELAVQARARREAAS